MPQWKVVGGEDKGGILVRETRAFDSKKCADRLSTGAIVDELELLGDRLSYKLVAGTGPERGWVTMRLPGKELLVLHGAGAGGAPEDGDEPLPIPEDPEDAGEGAGGGELRFPRMYFPQHAGPLQPQAYGEFWEDYSGRLMAGDIVGPIETYPLRLASGEVRANAPGRRPPAEGDPVDRAFEARCKLVEENRGKVERELAAYKPPPAWERRSKPQLEREAPKMIPGDMYGVAVPPNLATLERLGAKWLTEAFHAAGTLPAGNSVARVVKFQRLPMTTKDAAGGAGPKAFLSVEYAQPDPELHTELFVKFPWDTEGTKETGGDALWRTKISGSSDSEFQECTVYRFLGPIFPFKIPKYYFADICRANTNYILVTEKVLFGGSATYLEGKKSASFGRNVVLPVAEKYFDFQLEPKMQYEMYYCLMRAQARLAAWDLAGKFDLVPGDIKGFNSFPPIVGAFEWPPKMKPKARDMKIKSVGGISERWREYLGDKAKRCYSPKVTDGAFVEALCEAMEMSAYQNDITLYMCLFPQMVAMQHANLQSDNAFYWRDGEMDCGIIDWGGVGPKPLMSACLGSITSAEGDVLYQHEVGFMRCFRDEFHRECGISLDLNEMMRQWRLQYGVYLLSMGVNIEQEIFREVPRDEWATIDSLNDERVVGNWNTRCYAFMIKSAVRYCYLGWVAGGKGSFPMYGVFQEWLGYWKGRGLE